MNPLRLLAFSLALSASLFAQDPQPAPEVPVSGPEELRQHIEPAKVVVDRFLAFYDQGNFKAAEKLMGRSSGLEMTSKYHEKKFGKFEGRTPLSVRVADTFAPEADGTYIIFNYRAVFENKKSFPTRVVVRLNGQGKYEVLRFGSPN